MRHDLVIVYYVQCASTCVIVERKIVSTENNDESLMVLFQIIHIYSRNTNIMYSKQEKKSK